MRVLTTYEFDTGKLARPHVFAVVSDLHNEPYEDLWPLIRGAEALLVPGDIANRYSDRAETGLAFIRDAAKRMPVFFSPGNHETSSDRFRQILNAIRRSGATVLDNRYVRYDEMWIGGWYDPRNGYYPFPMDRFEGLPGCKVLLCHKPHHYIKYIRDKKLDLVVAGHAHGGQIRLGSHGLYAPGQGFFPRYTKGIVDGRMIISAGVGNPSKAPRWNNPCEVLQITLR